jgi:hypothetical protein
MEGATTVCIWFRDGREHVSSVRRIVTPPPVMMEQRLTDDYRRQKCREGEEVRHPLSMLPSIPTQRLKRHFPHGEGRYCLVSSTFVHMHGSIFP